MAPSRYLLVWLLLALVATANGIVRELSYGRVLPELAAHQISSLAAVLASTVVVWIANRRWPIKSSPQAIDIGIIWLSLTIAFEFGFGHFVAGHSWQRLFADYNLLNGRVWSLFLLWVAVLPLIVYKWTAGNK